MTTTAETVSNRAWTIIQKISFRLFFVFFLLFIILNNNGAYPFWSIIGQYIDSAMQSFVPWMAKNVFELKSDITIFTNGSGDTTYDYLKVLIIFTAAIGATIIWSICDRRRTHYTVLFYWLTLAVRLYVGLMLVNYGSVKIIKLQFPSPDFYRLITPYGNSSPMGLAWTFLGFSKGYNYFTGIAEILAGLLLFRKTMVAGALVTMATTVNIMAVNYFFDVPVKIVSTMLVVMTMFLLAPYARVLCQFLFSNIAVSINKMEVPGWGNKKFRIAMISGKALILLYIGFAFFQTASQSKNYGDNATRPPLYGLYEVEFFICNNDTLPPLSTDSVRWKYIIVQNSWGMGIQYMNESNKYFKPEVDTTLKKIVLKDWNDTTKQALFTYQQTDSVHYIFDGQINDTPVSMRTKRKDEKDFLLTSRRFNWVSEYPFNR